MKIYRIHFAILLSVVLAHSAPVRPESRSMPAADNTDSAYDLDSLHALLKAQQPITWVFTGDSVTEGAKWTGGSRAYSEIFSERIRWEMKRERDIVINTAISGNTTDDILDDFYWRIGHLHPNIVSLMIGINDSVRGPAGEPAFESNLRRLVEGIRAIHAIPILQTTNWTLEEPLRADLPAYNAIVRKVATSERVILVDNWQYWQKHRTSQDLWEWLGNPIHPNGLGHAEIAHRMFLTLGINDPCSAMLKLGNP